MTEFEKILWSALYAFMLVGAGVAAFDAKPIALLIFTPVIAFTNCIFSKTIEGLSKELKPSKRKKRP